MQFRVIPGAIVTIILLLAVQTTGCTGSSSPATLQQLHASSITAMEGYQIAADIAKGIYNDTIFTIISDSTSRHKSGFDGKSDSWTYYFASIQAKRMVQVSLYYNDSTWETYVDNDLILLSDKIRKFRSIHPVSDWKVDSNQAVQAALPRYSEKYGTMPISASYSLYNLNDSTGNPAIYWEIHFLGGKNQSVTPNPNNTLVNSQPVTGAYFLDDLYVFVDATTGAIISKPVG